MKIAILADIHSNLEALHAVLEDTKKQGVKRIICAGDLVGYNSSPNEVVDLVKKEKILSIQGNHDIHACDLKEIDKFNIYAQPALKWTNKQLTEENKKFLTNLHQKGEGKIDGREVVMFHGSPDGPLWDYIFPTVTDEKLKLFLEKTKADILVFGHTHLPFIRRVGGKIVINPGSAGQPRDNNPKAAYCLLDLETLSCSVVRVEYDIESAAKKNLVNGLPRYLADRLFIGQ